MLQGEAVWRRYEGAMAMLGGSGGTAVRPKHSRFAATAVAAGQIASGGRCMVSHSRLRYAESLVVGGCCHVFRASAFIRSDVRDPLVATPAHASETGEPTQCPLCREQAYFTECEVRSPPDASSTVPASREHDGEGRQLGPLLWNRALFGTKPEDPSVGAGSQLVNVPEALDSPERLQRKRARLDGISADSEDAKLARREEVRRTWGTCTIGGTGAALSPFVSGTASVPLAEATDQLADPRAPQALAAPRVDQPLAQQVDQSEARRNIVWVNPSPVPRTETAEQKQQREIRAAAAAARLQAPQLAPKQMRKCLQTLCRQWQVPSRSLATFQRMNALLALLPEPASSITSLSVRRACRLLRATQVKSTQALQHPSRPIAVGCSGDKRRRSCGQMSAEELLASAGRGGGGHGASVRATQHAMRAYVSAAEQSTHAQWRYTAVADGRYTVRRIGATPDGIRAQCEVRFAAGSASRSVYQVDTVVLYPREATAMFVACMLTREPQHLFPLKLAHEVRATSSA